MRKKRNSGFSIVEVLIALAIFLILMIPITKGIIQALNMSTGSKELQYRNEFAEGIMEHVKSVEIDELLASEYYIDAGTDASSFSTSRAIYSSDTSVSDYAGPPITADKNGDGKITADETFEFAQYEVSGTVKLGTKHEEYNYLVDVDSYDYANSAANDTTGTFLDPNNLALGIVEDVDYTKVALIDDQVFNYDQMAENSLKAKKLQGLREIDEEAYRQAVENADNVFAGDEGYRMMTIKVSGDKTNGYKVQCILDYYDESNNLSGTNHFVEYSPYGKIFKKGMPNIYVLYNPCHYNGNYSKDDYITIDTSELKDTQEEVKVFLVEVASTYSQAIVDSGAIDAANSADDKSSAVFDENQTLYNTTYGNFGHDRDSVKVHVGALVCNNGSTSPITKLHLYSNIGDNTKDIMDEDGNITTVDKRNKKTDSSKFLYSNTDGCVNTMFNSLISFMYSNNTDSHTLATFRPLTGQTNNDAVVGHLNDASEESRGMYNVKVYLKKASEGAIDTTSDLPILTGTKGGNES